MYQSVRVGLVGIVYAVTSTVSVADEGDCYEPCAEMLTKLVAHDAGLGDRFGSSVALDATRAAVGAPWYGGADEGAVYVFESSGGAWHETATLMASDRQAGDRLGRGDLCFDGDWLYATSPDRGAGAVYAYFDDGGVWSEIMRITPDDAVDGDRFGSAIACEDAYMVVGAKQTTDDPGKAYVLRRDHRGTPGDPGDDTWVTDQVLTASDGEANDKFGTAVAIQMPWIFVTAICDDDRTGALYVFEKIGDVWTQIDKLRPSDAFAGDEFGARLSALDDMVAVGAFQRPVDGVGRVVTFAFDGVQWVEHATVTPFDGEAGDCFGACTLAEGGLVVGAWSEFGTRPGALYVYRLHDADTPGAPCDDVWIDIDRLVPDDVGEEDWFARCPKFADGKVLVGAEHQGNVGAAYVYDVAQCMVDPCAADLDNDGLVDVSDLLLVLAQWGACPPTCIADLDGDAFVDVTDMLQVLASWGPCLP